MMSNEQQNKPRLEFANISYHVKELTQDLVDALVGDEVVEAVAVK